MAISFTPFRTLALMIGTFAATWAQAQSCDDLVIDDVLYGAFNDSTVMVDVTNNSNDFLFGYPQFMLIDTEGDTLTDETVNFFGIGVGGQTHHMQRRPGMELPPTPFTGSLVLKYMGSVDPWSTCTFVLTDHPLCPPAPCAPVRIYMQANAFPAFDAEFTWYLTDSDGNTVDDGTFSIDAEGDATDMQSICVPPGDLTLHVARPFGTEGEYVLGITRNGNTNGPITHFIQQEDPSVTTDLPFTYFPLCAEISNGITDPPSAAPTVTFTGSDLLVSAPDAMALGLLEVIDAAGRPVRRVDARSSSVVIPLSGAARGMYLLRSISTDRPFPTQRFVIP